MFLQSDDDNALVITYHVKNCQRVGGFHYFINYLEKLSYDIDWVTCPVSLSWILHRNDRENFKNFMDLWRGIAFEENNVQVRHFSAPVFMPAKIARVFGMEIGYHYWPAWEKLRKRMKPEYDMILVEGVGCQYAFEMRKSFPKAKIVYRPSDILETFSDVPGAFLLEKGMIETADITLCVDEIQQKYYKSRGLQEQPIEILRNPLCTENDMEFVRGWMPEDVAQKTVVYVGISGVDLEMIEYAASQIKNATFVVVGPFDRKSHDNIVFLGSLSNKEFLPIVEKSSVGINPILENVFDKQNQLAVGYTRKIIRYMKYLLPVVTTCSCNYLNLDGFYVAKDKDEFCRYVNKALQYSAEERINLRLGYMKAMELFLNHKVEQRFEEIVLGGR